MRIPAILLFFIWVVFALQELVHPGIKGFGIVPRTPQGLWGLFACPFIHGSLEHIGSNTTSFFILLSSVFYFYPRIGFKVFWQSWLLVGLLVWVGARPSNHIGASGLIYAYASFMAFAGFASRNKQQLAISLLVVFMYGSMIWGVFPVKEGISWESHLYGLLAGLVLAYAYLRPAMQPAVQVHMPTDIPADHAYFTSNSMYLQEITYIYKEQGQDDCGAEVADDEGRDSERYEDI